MNEIMALFVSVFNCFLYAADPVHGKFTAEFTALLLLLHTGAKFLPAGRAQADGLRI